LQVGYEKERLKATSEFGKEAKAIAAINGTFFDIKKGGSIDYIRYQGETIHQNVFSKPGIRGVHQKAAIVIAKGKLKIQEWDNTDDWESKMEGEDVMVSGPLLLQNRKKEKLDSVSFMLARHPRTVVVTTKKETLLITVDGRNQNAHGMSLHELTKVIQWLGAIDAINLDGGGSTTLWIYNQPDNGVVNYPADNMKWDHQGERGVANVIIVKRKK